MSRTIRPRGERRAEMRAERANVRETRRPGGGIEIRILVDDEFFNAADRAMSRPVDVDAAIARLWGSRRRS